MTSPSRSADLSELDLIARERLEGRHATCRLDVHRSVWEQMQHYHGQHVPHIDIDWGIRMLTGLPVIIDQSLAVGRWRLVDLDTGATVRAGSICLPAALS